MNWIRHTLAERTRIALFFSLFVLFCFGCDMEEDDDENTYAEGLYPTTLDVTIQPEKVETEEGEFAFMLGRFPGEPHVVRNDLGVTPSQYFIEDKPLSIAYTLAFSDTHMTDEESPTRLTFFDSDTIFFGAFESAYRPQEDLAPHTFNGLVQAANRVMVDYQRDFDMAIVLGDLTDNAQKNEFLWALDVMDAGGVSSGLPGICRPDSGDLDIDPETGLNRGERDFGVQEVDADGNNINPFNRAGRLNSNADFEVTGLRGVAGQQIPWLAVVGNHDALNTGNFDPDSSLTFFTRSAYTAAVARYGLQPGLANVVQFANENPELPIELADGIFGIDMNFGKLVQLLNTIGLIPENYYDDLNPDFDLYALTNNTLDDGTDDGIAIAGDENREFIGMPGFVQLAHNAGHGFTDNNGDNEVNGDDGGYYAIDFSDLNPDRPMPLRFLVLNSAEEPTMAAGGISVGQMAWLAEQLDQAVADQVLVIVCSHHQSHGLAGGTEELIELLQAVPNVIAHINGHGHKNDVIPQRYSGAPLRSYWEIQTPSSTGFPQQARIMEIVDHRDGTGSIILTQLDHSVDTLYDTDDPAALGKWEAFQDVIRLADYSEGQPKGLGGLGTINERNRELLFAIPDQIAIKLADIPATEPVTSWEKFGR